MIQGIGDINTRLRQAQVLKAYIGTNPFSLTYLVFIKLPQIPNTKFLPMQQVVLKYAQ